MNENRCFQESYLVLKTLHWRHHCCLPCCASIAVVEGGNGLAGWLAGCLSGWQTGHPVMDLFEWIKTGPWLYKYPQIMCPIIVFTSTKQRSSRWFIISTIGIFTPAGIEPGRMEWVLHMESLSTLSGTSKFRTWCTVDYLMLSIPLRL